MCIEPLCPVMIHGGSVDRCVEHTYARLAAAESLLREHVIGSTIDPDCRIESTGKPCTCCRTLAFLAQPTEDQ